MCNEIMKGITKEEILGAIRDGVKEAFEEVMPFHEEVRTDIVDGVHEAITGNIKKSLVDLGVIVRRG